MATKSTRKRPVKKRRKAKASASFMTWLKPLFWKLLITGFVIGLCFVIYLDAAIRHTFIGKMWELPAKVYARPLELFQGKAIAEKTVVDELKWAGYIPVKRLQGPGQFAVSGSTVQVYTRAFQFWDSLEASRKVELSFNGGRVSRMTSAGSPADLVRLEPIQLGGIYPGHNEDRVLLQLKNIPLPLQQMLVSVEDRDFYSNWGVSPRAIARATVANIKAGRIVQGGSTLTQQLVKNYYLTSERKFYRKGVEAIMALLLELHYSKEQILEGYMNEVFLAQDGSRAIHGFGLAAPYFFNKPLQRLTIPQQAMLIALVRGPSYYNPWRNPERAKKRRNLVLQKYAEAQGISPAILAQWQAAPLVKERSKTQHRSRYPAYLDLVREQLKRDYNADDLQTKGLNIFTSFDPQVQLASEIALSQQLNKIDRQYALNKQAKQQMNGAVVVTQPMTGEVLAVVGGKNPRFAGFNRALNAVRPIGSLMKPAVYLTALEQSDKYTLVTPLSDKSLSIELADGSQWQPQNYSKKSHGTVPFHTALTHSYNQATASLGIELGIGNIIKTVRKLGVESRLPAVPSVVLGTAEMSPLTVAQMFQTISSGGFYTPLKAIRNITSYDGQPLKRYPLKVEKRFDEQPMQLLQYNLREVMREGTGRSAYKTLPQSFDTAGKTGTTNDLRDSWFAGFSGDRLAVVWVGRDDNGSTPLTGATGALPVWTQIMAKTSRQPLYYQKMAGMEYLWIDRKTGRQTSQYCDNADYLPFVKGTGPSQKQSCGAVKKIKNWLNNWLD